MSLYFSTLGYLVGAYLFYYQHAFLFISFCLILLITSSFYFEKIRLLALLFIIFILFAYLRANWFERQLQQTFIEGAGLHKTYKGIVVKEPDVREKVTHYIVAIKNNTKETLIRVTMRHYPELHYQDTVFLMGLLRNQRIFKMK